MQTVVEALYPYKATDGNQLSLQAGERITVVQREAGSWWIGRNSKGDVGMFPSTYIREIDTKPKFNVPKEFKAQLLTSQLSDATATSGSPGGASRRDSGNITPHGAGNEKRKMYADLGFDEEDYFSPDQKAQDEQTQKLIRLRRECKALEHDIAKMDGKLQSVTEVRNNDIQALEDVKTQMDTTKQLIHTRSLMVDMLERNIARCSAALHGKPQPEYNMAALAEAAAASHPSNQKSEQTSAAAPSTNPNANVAPEPEAVPASEPVPVAPQAPEDPLKGFENASDLDEAEVSDKVGRKLIKKLKKRIAEADEALATYAKQEKKLTKKIAKLTAANGENAAAGGDPELQAQVDAARKSLSSVVAEVDALKQGASSDTQTKVEEMAAKLQKLQKRYKKGTEASKQLEAEIQAKKDAQLGATTEIENLEREAAELEARAKTSQDEHEKAVAAAKKELKAVKADAKSMHERLQKEIDRNAEYEKELMRLNNCT